MKPSKTNYNIHYGPPPCVVYTFVYMYLQFFVIA